MGWSGKVVLGGIGAVIAGPAGAALGAALGHLLDEEESLPVELESKGVIWGIVSPDGPGLGLLLSATPSDKVPPDAQTAAFLRNESGFLKSQLSDYADQDGDLRTIGRIIRESEDATMVFFIPYAAIPPQTTGTLTVTIVLVAGTERLALSDFAIELPARKKLLANNLLSALVHAAVAVVRGAGELDRLEVRHIRQQMERNFELNETGQEVLRVLLKSANAKPMGEEALATLLSKHIEPENYSSFVSYLFEVARADGEVAPAEEEFISGLCARLGVPKNLVEEVRGKYVVDLSIHYAELELQPGASWVEVRSAYRRLASEYHPDHVHNMPKGFQEFATRKMMALNVAFETLEIHLKKTG